MSEPGGPKSHTADRIVAMRLWMHRRLDALFDRLTDKDFTGTIAIELSGKDGRPGEPKARVEEYGAGAL
jgi:hypothetical protein